MNVSKIISCDIYNGVIKNKRFLIVPILIFFECMYNDNYVRMMLISLGGSFGKLTIFDLFTLIFRGGDPISKMPREDAMVVLPYFWIAIFAFSVFIGFEYMHNDLTQFGTQILTRCRKRRTWWYSKCIWCIASSLWFYILAIGTLLLYAVLNGYIFKAENNYNLTNFLAMQSAAYEPTINHGISVFDRVCLIIAPFAVICALNMIEMLLCLFFKPIYSYLVSIALIIAGTFTDTAISFTRCAMLLYNRDYFEKGYNTHTGIIICLIIIPAAIIIGGTYFKRANILPDKE